MEQRKPVTRGMDYLLECEQDFYALPLSLAFEEVVRENLLDRETHYRQQAVIELDNEDLPRPLRDAFYFPSEVFIEEMSIDLLELPGDAWSFSGTMKINNIDYTLASNDSNIRLSTNGSDGGELEFSLDGRVFTKLLATIIFKAISDQVGMSPEERAELIQEEMTPSQRANIIDEYNVPLDGTSMKNLLEGLAHTSGQTRVTTRAAIPYQHGDRAIVATLREDESVTVTGAEASIDLDWQLLARNTELSGTIGKVFRPTSLNIAHGSVSGTDVPVEDYAFSKQMSGLVGERGSSEKRTSLDTQRKEWLNLVAIFMTTIGPAMKKYRYLDETTLD